MEAELEYRGSHAGWDLTRPLAEIHEHYLLPAMYAQWAIRLTHLADIEAGFKTLDAGCGTGILARKMAEEVGFGGTVCGVDTNAEMLALARRQAANIDFRQADASALPFADAQFDRVLSQFMLPLVKNPVGTLKELRRVLRPGGKLALAVWAALHHSPGFDLLVRLSSEMAGIGIAATLAKPWDLGFETRLRPLLESAGFGSAEIAIHKGTARFPGVGELVGAFLVSSGVREQVRDGQYRNIVAAAAEQLGGYRQPSGELVFPLDAIIVQAPR